MRILVLAGAVVSLVLARRRKSGAQPDLWRRASAEVDRRDGR